MAIDIDVEKRRGERIIAARFTAGPGLTALFGPSGVGKTSLLAMVAGLLRPDRGHIRIGTRTLFGDDVDLPPEARRIGYVFQDGRLFPHRRVRANLLYGHQLAAPGDRWMGLDEAAAFLGIGHLLDRWPRSLSGGEAQRVAIGRALLAGPEILLMDEPLSSLDAARRGDIMAVIERIRDELKLPILYVSHDRAEVDRLATEVIALDG
ncbi:ATP-binding cassette domain-containing protein [Sphingopyxis sp. GW247-27LB]|uniref:ATP-binding cassette domain-containing protein n=1 Tax=Sphingopyxis sp. GW247-27LB TaxID=2012632 RepID=UPI000BA575B0|nr:ATP-binding cassette domain-containing protein [Sphingopyxis sp. GW247-27LB]PAL21383.1 molybdenum ABC transporter ATP-binding protein [Sphingopyxis sp. GW247-27LB]